MSKNILLYYPSNKRTIAMETLIIETKKSGFNIIVLTLSKKAEFQETLLQNNIEVLENYIERGFYPIYLIKQIYFLIKICKENTIDIVWSHLHPCNFYAVIAQFFMKSKVIIFRHHFHANIKIEGFKNINKNELLIEKVISRLANKIIVPSAEVYNGMKDYEKINEGKIQIIPYIYNFEKYDKPNEHKITEIRSEYQCKTLILVAMRMIKLKRHSLVLPVFNNLINEGYDIQVILLDEGDEMQNLQQYVHENKLSERIHFLGYKKNVIDYISASDIIIHPSSTEASSSFIKEAGLMSKAVIVCKGVGDFDDYIINNYNGILIENENEEKLFYNEIKILIENQSKINTLGINLKSTVLEKFSISESNLSKYLNLLND